jgi:hypothetical protein
MADAALVVRARFTVALVASAAVIFLTRRRRA